MHWEEYTCEQCGEVFEGEPAHTEEVQGHRETILLTFCEGCSDK